MATPEELKLIENSGVIGFNDFKADNAKAPNRKGRAKVGGLWYWVADWTRDVAKGGYVDSLAFTLMTEDEANKAQAKAEARFAPQQGQQQQQHQAQAQPQQAQQQVQQQATPAQTPTDFDDDIPF